MNKKLIELKQKIESSLKIISWQPKESELSLIAEKTATHDSELDDNELRKIVYSIVSDENVICIISEEVDNSDFDMLLKLARDYNDK
ncbi:hypothetical protein [Pectobacterium brasiliense]|uniref:hypothetical protein n=1 Tax=Pectobacterium brasiliense TaxID=180957 RepID=UPI002A826036|nr:hypothetical protein [Pectobacterium brasiliense]MDY4384725.1 hypothetical protein [Pectobacterium brasiliense]